MLHLISASVFLVRIDVSAEIDMVNYFFFG